MNGPWAVFEGDHPCTDGYVKAIIDGPGSGEPGTVWLDPNENSWSVSTCLVNQETQDLEHIGYFRFLPENPVDENDFGPARPIGYPGQSRYPRGAGIFFPAWDNGTVEILFVIQWWDEQGEDWDLLIERHLYTPDEFANEDWNFPTQQTPAQFVRFNTEENEMAPDIAYDPETGDVYIVYTKEIDPDTSKVYLRWGYRQYAGNAIQWTHEQEAQDDTHNGTHPRIDIGRVTIFPFNYENIVAVAYINNEDENNFRVHINYWPTSNHSGPFDQFDCQVLDPDHADYPAGFPVVDIGPPGTDIAALVFMQEVEDQGPTKPESTYIDTRSFQFIHLGDIYNQNTAIAYPSVAVHDTNGNPFESSVSLLVKDFTSSNNPWHPHAHIVTNNSHVYTQDTITRIDDELEIHGYWSLGYALDNDFGINTSLVVYESSYWLVWSSTFGVDVPETVHGSYGFLGT